ncbi:hypothetical protein UFOVP373_41 [uncultured Caudovirales phage]|uniref:Uncharacterized protein n=1 Tax=uncultured Caudovirales phage TaxID=2100421 RepID=A0A6J7WXZ8_9CAUD|nr:hypothetical protein UFOVP373_41 [uncultured Caudovirales phage]
MGSILPAVPGLDINGVFYRYTINKNPQADAMVHVQNENALGAGYIFRQTDDWSGLPGNTITKAIPVANVPLRYWGLGSIDVEGEGSISGASVIYTYRVDECANPQASPTCEGYEPPVQPVFFEEPELYDALEDDAYRIATAKTDQEYDDEEKPTEEHGDDKERKARLERGLSASKNALALANGVSQDAIIAAMGYTADMAAYYAAQLDGGAYADAPMLIDGKIPENKRGLRNGLAQQVLHDQMMQLQYQ